MNLLEFQDYFQNPKIQTSEIKSENLNLTIQIWEKSGWLNC